MTRLRTAGDSVAAVETRFGKERAERLLRQAEPFMGIGEAVFRGRPTGDSGGEVPGVGCRDRRVVRSGRLIVE